MSEVRPGPGGRKATAPDEPPTYGLHTPARAPQVVARRPPRPRKGRTLGKVRDAAMLARAERVAETATAIAVRLEAELAHLNELRNAPGSKGFEVVGAPSSVLYCDAHDRELADCRREAERANVVSTCTGEPLPPLSDPTGTAVLHDPVAADVRTIGDALGRMEREATRIVDVLARYQPRPANLKPSTTGSPGCDSCRRIKGPGGTDHWWNPPRLIGPTDLNGALARKHLLCSGCEMRIRRTIELGGPAELPPIHDLATYRDTGLWPKQHAT